MSWQAGGVVPLASLAAQFALGSELLMSLVAVRINKTIHGRLEGGLLYTSAYIARIKAQVGYLRCKGPWQVTCRLVEQKLLAPELDSSQMYHMHAPAFQYAPAL